MSEYITPVPTPAYDAKAPEVCREIYGMPMFVIAATADLEASKDFWLRGLGFIDLFTVPGQMTHVRRWAFQDVLLVPGEPAAQPGAQVSFSCVLSQIDEIAEACERLLPGSVSGPVEQFWGSIELTVSTPEGIRVVMTAAQPLDPNSERADLLRTQGYEIPRG
ncbi:VOC family protein [Glycomyces sp. YM15]|uniref:VOC family protein n=1 Tax=Glycomyces sp. YM15 TaxID=2800446 RepID=UPI001966658E|nr:VOC family protein [Glycomyces sp. YM15]